MNKINYENKLPKRVFSIKSINFFKLTIELQFTMRTCEKASANKAVERS